MADFLSGDAILLGNVGNSSSSDSSTDSNTDETKKELNILIQGEKNFIPAVLDGITWELNRKGAPGKLSFKVLQDDVLEMEEGNLVQLSLGEENLFKGYIFTRKMNKDKTVSVTAYDQIRYLKNKDIYEVVGKKASELVEEIANDFKLNYKSKDKDGNESSAITDTWYIIPRMRASNETLLDIIQKALDHTLVYTNKIFVLYDNFGVLSLSEIGSMDVPILIDAETAQNFDYSSSIDKDVYNKVKLYEDDKEAGKRKTWYVDNQLNIKKWGILQKCESVNTQRCQNPMGKATTILETYGHTHKKLSIKGAFGDIRVRAGSRIWVSLKVRDKDVNLGYDSTETTSSTEDEETKEKSDSVKAVQMIVERVSHKFSNGEHTMDLTLVGRGIN